MVLERVERLEMGMMNDLLSFLFEFYFLSLFSVCLICVFVVWFVFEHVTKW